MMCAVASRNSVHYREKLSPTVERKGGRIVVIVWTAPRPGEEGSVGHVRATITVANRLDQALVERGELDAAEARSATLDGVMVDTGATLLALPIDVIDRLGLGVRRTVTARTAAGPRQIRQFRDVELTVMGRSGTFDCLEVPTGSPPLLGVTPMEILGVEPDIQNHTLRLLPEGPDDSHILLL